MNQSIVCQHCGKPLEITEAISHQLRAEMEKELSMKFAEKEKSFLAEKETMLKKQAELAEKEKSIAAQVEEKLQAEKKQMWAIAQKKAAEQSDLKMKDLEEQNKEKEKKLKEFQEQELALRKQARELEEKAAAMKLENERKLDEERKGLMAKAKEQAEVEMGRKMMEKDQQMEQMKKTIDELKRRSEQGSMQLQGDAQENNLKSLLMQAFVFDTIDDVPTGIRGADLVQTVRSNTGGEAGILLWESKNAKNWSDEWVKKLKEDQGRVKASLCIIATTVLPEGIRHFGEMDGVWVVEYSYAIHVAGFLRHHLIEMNRTETSLVGRDEKMQMMYQYLSGSQFKNRVENILMAFTSMKQDLESEKRVYQKHWSKREKELERVIMGTSGMYGDLQGIIGAALPTIATLELEEPEEE